MAGKDTNTRTAITGLTVVALTTALVVFCALPKEGARVNVASGENGTVAPLQQNAGNDGQAVASAVAAHGDAVAGEALFLANCSACHQADGKGKAGLAPCLRNRDFLALASDDFIRKTIKLGRFGTSMIPRPDLSDAQVGDIIAWLRSVPVPVPLNVSVDPEITHKGDAAHGTELFGVFCATCHGAKGEGYSAGGPGPAIGLDGFLSTASDDFIFKTIKYGRIGTAMNGFVGPTGLANLSEQDVKDIVASLRSGNLASVVVPEAAPVSKGELIAEGKNLFAGNCGACHSPEGTGIIGLAPGVRNRDFLAIASDTFIKDTIKKGRLGTAMIARPDLNDHQTDAIIAWLRSLEVKVPVAITVDPTRERRGNATSGAHKFGMFCSSCHGANGEGYSVGGTGPGIGLSGFLSTASDDYIYATVSHGRIGTAMRGFQGATGLANLNEGDIHDIISHLRSLNKK